MYGPRATMSGDIWAYSEFINFPGGRPFVVGREKEEGRGESNYGHAARSHKEGLNEKERRKPLSKSLSEHNGSPQTRQLGLYSRTEHNLDGYIGSSSII